MDKVTQTMSDRQYVFVCQQAYVNSASYGKEIRRHPMSMVTGRPYYPPMGTPIVPIRSQNVPILQSNINQDSHDRFFGQKNFINNDKHNPWYNNYNSIVPTKVNDPIRPPLVSSSVIKPVNYSMYNVKEVPHKAYVNDEITTVSDYDLLLTTTIPTTTVHPFTLPPMNITKEAKEITV